MGRLGPVTPVTWLTSVPSTNTALRDALVDNGDCIATLNQTAGRGRLGRDWIDVPGKGVAVSIGFTEPVTTPTLVPLIAGAAAIDVLRSIAGAAESFWMKWPNDVYFGDHKLAGILTEMPTAGRIIVGMGVNLAHAEDELPVDTATSLAREGFDIDPAAFVNEWREAVLDRVDRSNAPSTVDWVNSRLGLRGESVRIDFPDGSQRVGTVVGVDAAGALLLDSGDAIVAGDITRLRPAD